MAGRWRIVRRTRYTRPFTRSVSYRYSSHGIMEQSPVSLGRSNGLANRRTSETSSWTAGVDEDGKPFLSSWACWVKWRQNEETGNNLRVFFSLYLKYRRYTTSQKGFLFEKVVEFEIVVGTLAAVSLLPFSTFRPSSSTASQGRTVQLFWGAVSVHSQFTKRRIRIQT